MNLILHLEKLSNIKLQNQLISLNKENWSTFYLEAEGPTDRKQGHFLITDFYHLDLIKNDSNTLRITVNDSAYCLK